MSDENHRMSRRTAVGLLAAAAAMAVGDTGIAAAPPASTAISGNSPGRLKQSFCRWPYARTPLSEVCRRAKEIGFSGIDLLYPEEWAAAREAGLTVSVGYATHREKFLAT